MPKQLKLYLDTSVPSFLFAADSPDRQEITKRFFEKAKGSSKYRLYVSDVTIREIRATPDLEKRNQLSSVVADLPNLQITDQAEELAERYLKEGIIPAKYYDDALHLAIATVEDMDVVLSWNFNHIVKLKTKQGITGLNTLLGYRALDIISPEELI